MFNSLFKTMEYWRFILVIIFFISCYLAVVRVLSDHVIKTNQKNKWFEVYILAVANDKFF